MGVDVAMTDSLSFWEVITIIIGGSGGLMLGWFAAAILLK